MPTRADDGSVIGAFIVAHEYASRFVSFADPLQHAYVVQTDAKQLQPDA